MAEIDPNFNESELSHDQEYQPELSHDLEQEYQPELAHDNEQEYQPELADDHEQEYQPELTHDHTQEYQPELAHDQEQEYQPELADDRTQEYQPELLGHDQEEVAQEHEPADGIPEILHPDEKEGHADEPVSGGGEKWPGWPGESLFRMLVPAQKVGSIIGRKGEYIKRTCEETKARIKILDGPPGMRERAVMVSAKEEPDMPIPPAINGLLSIHKQAVDGLDNDSSHPPPGVGGKVSTRLLLPASQAGNLIGKQGSTVKSIQEESNCIVRVLGAEELPIFALQDDRVVEVVGEPTGTHKAIELIACHLRKFLVDRSIIPVIEMQMQMPNPKMEHMPPSQPWGPPPPQSFPPPAHSGPGYGASLDFVRPPRQFDNYYPPSDMPQPPPPETQHHQGISAYGRETSMSSSSQAATSVITQVTQKMQIPLAYADGVIGTQGANISYTRRVSGATVTIQETRGVPGEMTVEISGTSSQVQTAQQLIQNFIAEAAAPSQAQQHAPPADHAYNSYGGQGSVYGSASSNPNIGSQGGGYGSVYGASYGY